MKGYLSPYPVAVADDRPRDASLAGWINRARSLCKMCFLGDCLQSSTLRCKLRPRRFLPAALAVGLSSCAGSDGTGPPTAGAPEVASVTVEPRAAMLWETGAQIRYAARVVDRDGREMTEIEVVWSSSEPDVAGIDASGLVTAAVDGWTVVRASVGGVTGGADAVIVTPDSPKDRRDCMACHAPEYEAQHGGSSTPTICLACHEGPSFSGALDHVTASGGFELLGAHEALSCQSCHEADGTPKFPGVADDECIACHQADYDGQHGGSGFPTTCLECHTRDSFAGATFDHDALFFPISSGKHQGKWSGCETCHTDPDDFSTFTCFSCHQHSQDRMDDKHSDVNGYSYDSAACYSCHPDGREP